MNQLLHQAGLTHHPICGRSDLPRIEINCIEICASTDAKRIVIHLEVQAPEMGLQADGWIVARKIPLPQLGRLVSDLLKKRDVSVSTRIAEEGRVEGRVLLGALGSPGDSLSEARAGTKNQDRVFIGWQDPRTLQLCSDAMNYEKYGDRLRGRSPGCGRPDRE